MGKYKVEEVLPIRLEDDRTKLMTPEAILAARNSTKRGINEIIGKRGVKSEKQDCK